MNFGWSDLLSALALLLVLEGIAPFLSPGAARRALERLTQLGDRQLRTAGLIFMVTGVVLLFAARS